MPLTYTEDGFLRFGNSVMLSNNATNGMLSFDLGDKVTSTDEAYAATTNPESKLEDLKPIARSVFLLARYEEDDGFEGDIVRYG